MRARFAKPTIPRPLSDPDRSKIDSFLIFDAANLAAKVFHVFVSNSRLSTKDGKMSGHVFGMLRSVAAAFNKFRKGRTALVFALEGTAAWRYALLPSYKGNRSSPSLGSDPRSEQVAALMTLPGYAILDPAGEADDAIATFVRHLEPHQRAFIFSSDRDLWQLIKDPTQSLISKARSVEVVLEGFNRIDVAWATMKLHVAPNQIALKKGIYGDSSDNIPKVHRMPRKFLDYMRGNPGWTNPDLLFRDLDKGRAAIERRHGDLLREYEEQIRICYKVASLRYDAPLLVEQTGSLELLNSIITCYEMNSLRALPGEWFGTS